MDTSKETFKAFQQDDVLSTADVASNVVIKPEEEYAYGFIIEVLTSGLYPDVFHVIREYVQNSFDAIIAWRRIIGDAQAGNMQITIDPPSIFVFDDATGMDLKKVREYRYVGYSNKSMGTSAGFRGIGKLSGISVAEKLILTTSPYGVAERYKLVFDAKTMLDHILELKQQGQNIPLNELIQKYTTLDIGLIRCNGYFVHPFLKKKRSEDKIEIVVTVVSYYKAIHSFPHSSLLVGWSQDLRKSAKNSK